MERSFHVKLDKFVVQDDYIYGGSKGNSRAPSISSKPQTVNNSINEGNLPKLTNKLSRPSFRV